MSRIALQKPLLIKKRRVRKRNFQVGGINYRRRRHLGQRGGFLPLAAIAAPALKGAAGIIGSALFGKVLNKILR